MQRLWPDAAQPVARSVTRTVAAPLILTAELPGRMQARLDSVRLLHYPGATVPAHLTLFRHLPGPQAHDLVRDLRRLLAETPAPDARIEGLSRLDGVLAAAVSSPALEALRLRLADWWAPLLVPADRSLPPLHVTLSARLSHSAIRALETALAPELPRERFIPRSLLLWQHDALRWTRLVRLAFRH